MKTGGVAIGVIGAGIMGERLLNAILAQDPTLLHACGVWDPAAAAMQRMARAFPQVPRLADAAAVIAASDCVYIASPPASHLDHARAAGGRQELLRREAARRRRRRCPRLRG